MCGILYAQNLKGTEPINNKIAEMYEDQSTRGTSGFGIAMIEMKRVIQKNGTIANRPNENRNITVYRSTGENDFLINLKPFIHPASLIMAHHRQPTSSQNRTDQTHPILVANGSLKYEYLMIHNGIIINYHELRKIHEELGFLYGTATERKTVYGYGKEFNDSECLAIELARYLEQQTDKINTEGSAAFVMLRLDKKTQQPLQLFFGRNGGNPLRFGRNNNQLLIASEIIGNEIEENVLHTINLDDEKNNYKLYKTPLILPRYIPAQTTVTTPAPLGTSTLPIVTQTGKTVIQYDDDNTRYGYASGVNLDAPELFPNNIDDIEYLETSQERKLIERTDALVEQFNSDLSFSLQSLVDYALCYNRCEETDNILKEIAHHLQKFTDDAEEIAVDVAALDIVKKDAAAETYPTAIERENQELDEHYNSIT